MPVPPRARIHRARQNAPRTEETCALKRATTESTARCGLTLPSRCQPKHRPRLDEDTQSQRTRVSLPEYTKKPCKSVRRWQSLEKNKENPLEQKRVHPISRQRNVNETQREHAPPPDYKRSASAPGPTHTDEAEEPRVAQTVPTAPLRCRATGPKTDTLTGPHTRTGTGAMQPHGRKTEGNSDLQQQGLRSQTSKWQIREIPQFHEQSSKTCKASKVWCGDTDPCQQNRTEQQRSPKHRPQGEGVLGKGK